MGGPGCLEKIGGGTPNLPGGGGVAPQINPMGFGGDLHPKSFLWGLGEVICRVRLGLGGDLLSVLGGLGGDWGRLDAWKNGGAPQNHPKGGDCTPKSIPWGFGGRDLHTKCTLWGWGGLICGVRMGWGGRGHPPKPFNPC